MVSHQYRQALDEYLSQHGDRIRKHIKHKLRGFTLDDNVVDDLFQEVVLQLMAREDTTRLDLPLTLHIASMVVAGHVRREKRFSNYTSITDRESENAYSGSIRDYRPHSDGKDREKMFWDDVEIFMEQDNIKPEKRRILRSVLHYLEEHGAGGGIKQGLYEAAVTETGQSYAMVRGTWRYYYPKIVTFLQEREWELPASLKYDMIQNSR